MSKTFIWVGLIVAVLVVGYLVFYGGQQSAAGEQSLSDVEYLLDTSVLNEVNAALNEVLLSGGLDKVALAMEADELGNLPSYAPLNELDQYFVEVGQ